LWLLCSLGREENIEKANWVINKLCPKVSSSHISFAKIGHLTNLTEKEARNCKCACYEGLQTMSVTPAEIVIERRIMEEMNQFEIYMTGR
jgi:hypothetical protein